MLFWSVFFKTYKTTVINRQKRPKWRFCRSITFFLFVLKNIDQKNICASIVFKAESKLKHEERKKFGGVFFKNQKHTFFGCPRWYFLKVKYQICISAFLLCALCKRKLHANFHKKILLFGPPGIFWKFKLWRVRQNFGIGLLKSYLTFGYLTWSFRSKKMSTLHPNIQ